MKAKIITGLLWGATFFFFLGVIYATLLFILTLMEI